MSDPLHQTILLTDIEGSGLRDDLEKPVIRRTMYEVVHAALRAAGAERTQYRTADRGDGVMLLIDPAVPRPRLLRAVLRDLADDLTSRNRLAGPGTRVRLRVVLHGGEVSRDPEGESGADLDAAFRMLDAEPLRAALRASDGPVVVGVSDFVHRGTVRHGYPGIPPESFRRTEFTAKEGVLPLWVNGPAGPGPAAPAAAGAPQATAPTGGVVFHTGVVLGDQIAGNKYVQGTV
ncbi:hypothetical protein GCM10010441_37720 [Kitasatospora paracochleata]|uniref:Class 3 adenylate cyclase n=1 Tax=Kitasatospora paracochleata TaxID=58354 RepID=A0ABT1J7B7_9ACTN|nr:hypothetical protein [Kitasatospora paracochleata]MCP2313332.1 hypothetical protein [Kitasatospora paracochleata]